jgi:NAD(P)-dependent dehydrogenase (short-subunit alcohol dehydrogenase family)
VSRYIFERAGGPAPMPATALVAGASGGIGAAFCRRLAELAPDLELARLARDTGNLASLPVRTHDIAFDIADEVAIAAAVAALPDGFAPQWVFVATGWLHDVGKGAGGGAGHEPEKTYRALDAEHLLWSYRVNAVGPALLLKHLLPRLPAALPCRIGVLSARVGSISDNRLGGWHSYRASKAGLNMLLRNFALEMGRRRHDHVVVGLQPGTTDTALSRPFQRNLAVDQLQTPDFTADRLVDVMRYLRREDSGGLFDFEGLPFAP